MPIVERSTRMVIRLTNKGCTNRPFYHLVVMKNRQSNAGSIKDQVGSYDPLPNIHNERLVAINFDRLRWWIGRGAECSTSVDILLGLAGYYPIHPRTKLQAFRIQRKQEEKKLPADNEQTLEADNS